LAVLAAVRPLPFELAAINPHAVQNDGELACDGNFNLPELLLKLDSGILCPSGAGADGHTTMHNSFNLRCFL
jgi:hypothetical protein